MNITIVGAGYVGLVAGACFSDMGNRVICVDSNKIKVQNLKRGILPIYEPGLKELILKNIQNKTLFFNTNLKEALTSCEIVFIAVNTPMKTNGEADLSSVISVAKEIGEKITHDIIVVNKSTVPIGTGDKVKEIISNEISKRNKKYKCEVVSNPEFLKEGDAINDFMKPDRVVIGTKSDYVMTKMKELYSPFFRTNNRFIEMDIKSAEITKYAANAMLATKISFMNEMANICEFVGGNINLVRKGIGSDSRIGYSFIYPGCGYGGSCFPKDINALIKTAESFDYNPELIKAVENINSKQKIILIKKIISRFGNNLKGLSFALWGLSFKPETDDMREAPSIAVVNELTNLGAEIIAYDPKAINQAKEIYFKGNKNIKYAESKYDALKKADSLILLTEWKEFRSPDFDLIKNLLKKPIIFDGRNQYNSKILHQKKFEYYQIGVRS